MELPCHVCLSVAHVAHFRASSAVINCRQLVEEHQPDTYRFNDLIGVFPPHCLCYGEAVDDNSSFVFLFNGLGIGFIGIVRRGRERGRKLSKAMKQLRSITCS